MLLLCAVGAAGGLDEGRLGLGLVSKKMRLSAGPTAGARASRATGPRAPAPTGAGPAGIGRRAGGGAGSLCSVRPVRPSEAQRSV